MLAIACGAAIGRGLGESAKAALTARGFAELMRFARAYGGRAETLMGLSGLGDVGSHTAASAQSRNFAFGEKARAGPFGRGGRPAGKLVDGRLHGRRAPSRMARAPGIGRMPISEAEAARGGRAAQGLHEDMDALMKPALERPRD